MREREPTWRINPNPLGIGTAMTHRPAHGARVRFETLAPVSFAEPNSGYSTHTGLAGFGRPSDPTGSGDINPRHSASSRLATTGAANRCRA